MQVHSVSCSTECLECEKGCRVLRFGRDIEYRVAVVEVGENPYKIKSWFA
jgi:hypothetical protein